MGNRFEDRSRVLSLRGVIAALLILVGTLHLVVADSRGSGWWIEGVALAVIGSSAIALALALVLSRARWPLLAVITVCGGIVVGLIVTRTSGYPFGPYENISASLGAYEVLVLSVATLCVSSSSAALIIGMSRMGEPGWRFDTVAPLIVVASALPGIAVSSWTEDAAHVAGAAHVHGGSTIDSSSQHGFAFTTELTIEERSRLGEQITSARAAASATPTLASALAAGWTRIGPSVPGSGQMLVDRDRRRTTTGFDPNRPVALLFASASDDAPIVAVQYEGWTKSASPPQGFVGQDSSWHLHLGTCLVDDVRYVYDESHVGTNCELIGGSRTNSISWMLRAWVVPGWENPSGTFAHDHPGIR